MGSAYTSRLVPSRYEFTTASIADGDYDFPLGEYSPNPNSIVDFIYCVDANGDPVTATAGTFELFGSPDGGKTFDSLQSSRVTATSATAASRTKPSGQGVLNVLRVTVSGLIAAGATGFSVGLSQHG